MTRKLEPSSGLPTETIRKIHKVFEHYPAIELVRLYGSRAKGNYHYGSDIDLTIMGDSLNFSQLLKVESELDDLLLPYKIDVSLFRQINNNELIDHINRVGTDFYSSLSLKCQNFCADNQGSDNKPINSLNND